jgi:hypothetical protein
LQFVDLGEPGGDVCLFDDLNPFVTILQDEFGQGVAPGDIDACPLTQGNPPTACVDFEPCKIPTVSEWGILVLTLLFLVSAKIRFARKRSESGAYSD